MTQATAFEPGLVIDGKYRIVRLLGQGGMGAVYEAYHELLAQPVALKVVLPEIGTNLEALTRFMNEARNSARIESEHVARVMDVGRLADGSPFMVMELLVGQDLDAVLTSEGPLPVARVADLLLEALDGISAAHALGIIHRDLKPANLFLAQKAGRPARVKVLDFGISKVLGATALHGAHVTSTATIVGSPAYMPPEQLRASKELDARADLWSLGVIAYQLATGCMPFDADNVGALFADIVESPPVSMRARRADIPAEFERVVLTCLQKRKEDRFQSAFDLAAALAPMGGKTAARAFERMQGSGSASPVAVVSAPGGVATAPSDPYAKTHISDAHVEATLHAPAPAHGQAPSPPIGMSTDGSWVTRGAAPPASPKPVVLLVVGAVMMVLIGAVGLAVRAYSTSGAARAPATSASLPASPEPSGAAPQDTSALAASTQQPAPSASGLPSVSSATTATTAAAAASASARPRAANRPPKPSSSNELFERF